MAVIELGAINSGSAEPEKPPKSRLTWRHLVKYLGSGMAGTIAALSFGAPLVDRNTVQEARAAANARQADWAAGLMNAWIGDRLFGHGQAPATGVILDGVVEFVENGKVTWWAADPLVITAVDAEVLRKNDLPKMWFLVQEMYQIGRPNFHPVEFRAVLLGGKNIQANLSGLQTPVQLNPCPVDVGSTIPAIGICAADTATGREFAPQILPGLAQYTN